MHITSDALPRYIATCLIILLTFYSFFRDRLNAAENPAAVFQEAEALFQKKSYAKAQRRYEKVILLDPSFTQGYRGIVRCYTALGDPQGAVIYMESLFLQNQNSADVCYGLGYALYNTKKYPEAKNYFEKAISLNPDLAAAWNNGAAIYHFILHDYAKARTYYEKAITISNRTGNQWVLETAQKNLANLPAAAAAIPPVTEQLSVEEFVNRFVAKVDAGDEPGVRALISGQKANCEPAMDWLLGEAMHASVQGKPEEEKSRMLLAALLEKEYRKSFNSPALKTKLDAYTALTGEKKKKIVYGEELLKRGFSCEQQGRYEEALQAYQDAAASFDSINDSHRTAVALIYAGDIYRKTKKYPLAHKAYSSALTCLTATREEGKKALVLSSLGITCFYLGEHSDALNFLNRSLQMYQALQDRDAEQKVKQNIELVKAQRRP